MVCRRRELDFVLGHLERMGIPIRITIGIQGYGVGLVVAQSGGAIVYSADGAVAAFAGFVAAGGAEYLFGGLRRRCDWIPGEVGNASATRSDKRATDASE